MVRDHPYPIGASQQQIAIVSLPKFAQNCPMSEIDQILAEINAGEAGNAARRNWDPQCQGEIDIRIAADGSWYHQQRRFQRDSLVKLFAGILRREDDGYFLVTPVEKLRIQVEDAPFVATLVECIEHAEQQAIVFTTNIGERIIADRDHAIRVEIDPDNKTPRPYIRVRDGLDALISRSAFYDLINMAQAKERNGTGYLSVTSLGEEFELGSTDE